MHRLIRPALFTLASVAAGAWPDCASASSALKLSLRQVEPNPETFNAYEAAYGRYRQLFAATEVMH